MSRTKEVSLTFVRKLSYLVALLPVQYIWQVLDIVSFEATVCIHKTKISLLISVPDVSTDSSFKGHELPEGNQDKCLAVLTPLIPTHFQLRRMEWLLCCRNSQYPFHIYFRDLAGPRRHIGINNSKISWAF